MRSLQTLLLLVSWSLLAAGARAQEIDAQQDDTRPMYEQGGMLGTGVVVGAKVGGAFGQPFGELGSSFLTELELGYVLPVLERSLSVLASGAYTQPKATGKVDDPRLGGSGSYELTQQQAMISLGLQYRLHLSSDLIRPYAAAGPRMYLMRTKAIGKGAAGEPFGENREGATEFGLFAALGCEFHFGPGAAFVEASMGWAKLDGYVFRDTSAGALFTSLGYRLFL